MAFWYSDHIFSLGKYRLTVFHKESLTQGKLIVAEVKKIVQPHSLVKNNKSGDIFSCVSLT